MNEREFIKLVRELQKIQLSLLYSTKLSSDLYTNCNLNNTSYISIYLFVLDINRNIDETHSYNLYSNDSIDKNKAIIDEISKRLNNSLLLYGGRKRSEAERSDAPIK